MGYSNFNGIIHSLFSGIYDEKYMKPIFSGKFLAGLKSNDLKKWKDENRKTVNESIREYAVKYIGRPIHDVIR